MMDPEWLASVCSSYCETTLVSWLSVLWKHRVYQFLTQLVAKQSKSYHDNCFRPFFSFFYFEIHYWCCTSLVVTNKWYSPICYWRWTSNNNLPFLTCHLSKVPVGCHRWWAKEKEFGSGRLGSFSNNSVNVEFIAYTTTCTQISLQ